MQYFEYVDLAFADFVKWLGMFGYVASSHLKENMLKLNNSFQQNKGLWDRHYSFLMRKLFNFVAVLIWNNMVNH